MFRLAIALAIAFTCVLSSSCALDPTTTERLWENNYYDETVDSFLITENGEKLVVIGRGYHYIFPLDDKLKGILSSDYRKYIVPHFADFLVDSNHKISGRYNLIVLLGDDEVQRIWLESAGFEFIKVSKDGKSRYHFGGTLNGKRYLANVPLDARYNFKKLYSLKIEEDASPVTKGVKALATPVTVSVDGIVMVAGFKLFMAFVVLVGATQVIFQPFN